MNLTVLKLGGSLLDVPDLADRLLTLVDHHQLSPAVVITGGGRLADVIRSYDRRWKLSADVCHQLAIATMGINAAAVRSLHERLVDSVSPAVGCVGVPAPDELLRQLETDAGESLPAAWDVTSDAIAAWLCGRMQGRRLILLKSNAPSGQKGHLRLSQLQHSGHVDPWLPRVVAGVPDLLWCNLRAQQPALTPVDCET